MKLHQALEKQHIKFIQIYVTILKIQHKFNINDIQTIKNAGLPKAWNNLDFWDEKYKHFKPYRINVDRLSQTNYKNYKILSTEIKDSLLIPTGKDINAIYCIDIDSSQFCNDLQQNYQIDAFDACQTLSCRKKLPHLYFKFTENTDTVFKTSNKFYIGNNEVGDLKATRSDKFCDCMWEEDIDVPNFHLAESGWEDIFKTYLKFKPKKTTKRTVYTNVEFKKIAQPYYMKMIDLLPATAYDDYREWIRYGLIFKTLGEEGFLLWDYLSSKSEKYESTDDLYTVWEELTPNRTGIAKLFADAKEKNPDMYQQIIQQTDRALYRKQRRKILPLRMSHRKYDEYYDQPYFWSILNVEKLCIILYGKMGAGKTQVIKEFLEKYVGSIKYVLTCRITMAQDLSAKLGFDNYLDKKFYHNTYELNKSKKLCIQMESLSKLNVPKQEYILILDEVESLLAQLTSSETYKDVKTRIRTHKLFQQLIQNATKIICADAFVTDNTLNILRQILGSSDEFYIIRNQCPYQERQIITSSIGINNSYQTSNANVRELGIRRLLNLLAAGKKVYIVHSTKKLLKYFQRVLERTQFKGVSYYGGQDDAKTEDFRSVDKYWRDLDYVQTTTTLTVGVSYDRGDFDCAMLFGSAFGASVRDIMQTLHRVRYLRDSRIYLFTSLLNNKNVLTTTEEIEDHMYFLTKELGLETIKEQWIKDNIKHNRLEHGISSRYFNYLLRDYLRLVNCKFVKEPEEIQSLPDELENLLTLMSKPVTPIELPKVAALEETTMLELLDKIYKKKATEQDKELIQQYVVREYLSTAPASVLNLFFQDLYKGKSSIQMLELIATIKRGGDGTQYEYIYNTTQIKAELLSELFSELDLKIPIDTTFIKTSEIESLELKPDTVFTITGKRVSSKKKTVILRALLKSVGLSLDRSRSHKRINGHFHNFTIGYNIIDQYELWTYVR